MKAKYKKVVQQYPEKTLDRFLLGAKTGWLLAV